jgi:hypothetical protein
MYERLMSIASEGIQRAEVVIEPDRVSGDDRQQRQPNRRPRRTQHLRRLTVDRAEAVASGCAFARRVPTYAPPRSCHWCACRSLRCEVGSRAAQCSTRGREGATSPERPSRGASRREGAPAPARPLTARDVRNPPRVGLRSSRHAPAARRRYLAGDVASSSVIASSGA